VNAITPPHSFDLAADRFDTLVANAFAANRASRHVRDDLIAQVDGDRLDHMLLRARSGVVALADAVNRKAALNIIDFAFEPLVMQGMSTDQAMWYLGAVENTLQFHEARGLDGFGPLWVDTVHHVCVFSVLFQLAAFLGRTRGSSRWSCCTRVSGLSLGCASSPTFCAGRTASLWCCSSSKGTGSRASRSLRRQAQSSSI
jgi:hypothetical protein